MNFNRNKSKTKLNPGYIKNSLLNTKLMEWLQNFQFNDPTSTGLSINNKRNQKEMEVPSM